MGRTSSKMDARERARQARLKVDADRDRRDRQIEDAGARYFTAHDERAELLTQIAAVEDRLRSAVGELLDLGESPARVAALLGIEAKEVRRLRSELQARAKDEQRTAAHEPKDGTSPSQAHPQDEPGPDAVHSHPAPVAVGAGA